MPSLRRGRRNIERLESLAKAIADQAPTPVHGGAPGGARRMMEDVVILALKERGLRNVEIAKLLKKSLRTIDRRLDMATLTREMLSSMLVDFAADWKVASQQAALQGDHRPAMDAIAAVTDVRVVKHIVDREAPTYQLQIGINLAGSEPQRAAIPAVAEASR